MELELLMVLFESTKRIFSPCGWGQRLSCRLLSSCTSK